MRSKLLYEILKTSIILPGLSQYTMGDGVTRTVIERKRGLYWIVDEYDWDERIGTSFINSKRELVSLVDKGGYDAVEYYC
jgi:hypothetical protein